MQPPWPADHLERWSIDRLLPYARNARTHSSAQIDQIAASMREWGWTNPVLVDEAGMVIAGHGRIEAARKLGWSGAPVMASASWPEAKMSASDLAQLLANPPSRNRVKGESPLSRAPDVGPIRLFAARSRDLCS